MASSAILNLGSIGYKVKVLLEEKEELRCSDYLLYYDYCLKWHNIDLKKITAKDFMLHRKAYGLPNFESVGRARRKVQELYPELINEEVRARRLAIAELYNDFAHDITL